MRLMFVSGRHILASLAVFFLAGAPSETWAQPTLAEAEARVATPFFSRTTFTIRATYYVAINEPGASNANNGKYPTYRGGVDGPFKDFTSATLRQILANANNGVAVYVRAGTYLAPDGGVRLRGGGGEGTPAILAGYPGDARPIIDGGECLPWDTIRAIASGMPYTPRVEAVVKIDGRYDIVQDLQLQCGFRHVVLTRGHHTILRRNILRGAYEDAIKNAIGADYGLVADNDISGFASQGLDHFAANHWFVTRNVFRDPSPHPIGGRVAANPITVKGSARNVVITRNTVRTFATDINQAAITLGAPSAMNLVRYDSTGTALPAAIDAVAMANTVEDFTGAAFALQSCDTCIIAENTVARTLGVVKVGIDQETRLSAADSGILPYSKGAVIRRNVSKFSPVDCSSSVYLGQSCYAMFVVNVLEAQGMSAGDNTYYSDQMPFFVYDWQLYDLAGLQSLQATETGSQIIPVALWP